MLQNKTKAKEYVCKLLVEGIQEAWENETLNSKRARVDEVSANWARSLCYVATPKVASKLNQEVLYHFRSDSTQSTYIAMKRSN